MERVKHTTPPGLDSDLSMGSLEIPGKAMLQTIWRRKWLVAACAGVCVSVAAVNAMFIAKPVYRAAAQIFLSQADARTDLRTPTANLETQSVVITSTPVLVLAYDKTRDAMTLDYSPIAKLKAGVRASVGEEDEIITITFDGPYEGETEQILAAVVQAYKEHIEKQQKSSAEELLTNLTREKDQREAELIDRQGAILEFRRESSVGLSPSEDARDNVALKQLQTFADAVTQQQLDEMSARTAFEEASLAIDTDAVKARQIVRAARADSSITVEGSDVQQLQADLFALQQRLKIARQQYLPEHPSLKVLAVRIEQYQLAYVAALEQRWSTSERKLSQLRDAFNEQQKVAVELNAKAAELARLEMDVKRVERILEVLDDRMKEINVAEITPPIKVNIIEQAQLLPGVVSPRKGVALFQGLMVGLVLGCGLTFLDRRFRSVDEVRAALKMPLLGVIPHMAGQQGVVARAQHLLLDRDSDAAEAYRAVRTQLTFGTRDKEVKTILITSPSPGDGKTTLASNLAIALAQAGHKTLLVDADFRRPQQHKIFAVRDRIGLSSVLQGKEILDDAAHRTNVDLLEILPAGPLPQDPSELLNGQELADLLNTLAGRYDYVLIDSPPVRALSDARVLGAMCDATLLVISAPQAARSTATAAAEALGNVGANLLGVVVNNAPRHGWRENMEQGYRDYHAGAKDDTTHPSSTEKPLGLTIKQKSA